MIDGHSPNAEDVNLSRLKQRNADGEKKENPCPISRANDLVAKFLIHSSWNRFGSLMKMGDCSSSHCPVAVKGFTQMLPFA